jgi:hypothetical protein
MSDAVINYSQYKLTPEERAKALSPEGSAGNEAPCRHCAFSAPHEVPGRLVCRMHDQVVKPFETCAQFQPKNKAF